MATNNTPRYSFLSKPPPPQKKRPTQPLPSPPYLQRTTFSSTIASWAAHVQPGSPPPRSPRSPRSPRRRTSTSSRRRPSLTLINSNILHTRVPSSPFITTTPTTAHSNSFDLTALGYTSLFVHLPKTPSTPSPLLKAKAKQDEEVREAKRRIKDEKKEESKEKRVLMMKRFRSLTLLRPRGKSVSAKQPDPLSLVSPTFTTATAPHPLPKSKSKPTKKATSTKKRALYASVVRPPPPLANELALMQFADGGKMEDHIRRAMMSPDGAHGDVYRDGKGGIWWDREEEMEYRGLLGQGENDDDDEGYGGEECADDEEWVKFDFAPVVTTTSTATTPELMERRDSVSTVDSDLDPVYIMHADDEMRYHDERVLNLLPHPKPSHPSSAGVVLALPPTPRRLAKHLQKPELVVDRRAFAPLGGRYAGSSYPYPHPRSPVRSNSNSSLGNKRGAARRRPVPLTLTSSSPKGRKGSYPPPRPPPQLPLPIPLARLALIPPQPAVEMAVAMDVDEYDAVREGKREFLLDTFEPEVSRFEFSDDGEDGKVRKEKEGGMRKKGSRLDLRGIFGRRGD